MMSDDEIIAIIHARKQGKKLQLRHMATAIDPDPVWYDCPNQVGQWGDFYRFNYRIAPEPRKPREWVVPVFRLWSSDQKEQCEKYYGEEIVRVREVIE